MALPGKPSLSNFPLEDLEIDKPVLLAGSGKSIERFKEYGDFFTLCSGKSLYAIDKVNIVTSLDLIRIIHNISNFRKRWDYYLVPSMITNHLSYGTQTGILKNSTQKDTIRAVTYSIGIASNTRRPSDDDEHDVNAYLYVKSPVHSRMYFKLEDFDTMTCHHTHTPNEVKFPFVYYEQADRKIDFSKYNVVRFQREDIDSIERMKAKDGVLRNIASSLHFLINWLWLKGVKEINTIGITKEHHTWENTRLLFDLYGMKYKRLEDDINIT